MMHSWVVDLTKHDAIIPCEFLRVLDKKGSIPPGMVRVTGADTKALNGKYGAQRNHLFDLLGTLPARKKRKLYETDHVPPRNEFIEETLAWLDRHLGPVRP